MARFTLIIPDELNEWLKQQATNYRRSKNQHIVVLMEAIQATAAENRERLAGIELREPDMWPTKEKDENSNHIL